MRKIKGCMNQNSMIQSLLFAPCVVLRYDRIVKLPRIPWVFKRHHEGGYMVHVVVEEQFVFSGCMMDYAQACTENWFGIALP